MKAKITSDVTGLPISCKSVMEQMTQALEEEDCFEIARINGKCESKIDSLEKSLSDTLGKQISLVAYQKKEES